MQRIVQPFSYFFLPNSVLCFVQLELLGQKHNKKRDLIMSDPLILFCTMVLEQRIIFHSFIHILFVLNKMDKSSVSVALTLMFTFSCTRHAIKAGLSFPLETVTSHLHISFPRRYVGSPSRRPN
jgi:hypothetical protein